MLGFAQRTRRCNMSGLGIGMAILILLAYKAFGTPGAVAVGALFATYFGIGFYWLIRFEINLRRGLR